MCKYCGEQMTSTITRVLKHLTGIGTTGHCGGCEAVPPALRDALILEHFPPGSTASSQSGGARAAAIAAEDALQDALLGDIGGSASALPSFAGTSRKRARVSQAEDEGASASAASTDLMDEKNTDLRDEKNADLMILLWLKNAALRDSAAENAAIGLLLLTPISPVSSSSAMEVPYPRSDTNVAFRSGDYKAQVIFLGGLTDGLIATEYIEPLAHALEVEKWSLVQPLLSSSYAGFGTSSLKQDAMELDQLITYLIDKEGSCGVMLLGHSTGCQDIVHYMRMGTDYSRVVRGIILQAPVSDREYRATLPGTAGMIDLAVEMIKQGRSMDLMPREAAPEAPITAYRYHSLCAFLGDDDMFSSDLTDQQLRARLGHMSRVHCQVIFSMADEYVPAYVNKKALVERLCKAMGGAEKVEIEWGNHSLSNRVKEAVNAILDFVKREGPEGWDDPWG
ncbi:hypothetical protein L7F22_051291 [Adiantum nelumboides]|nr:hypothetical protein [Adiantum nelumboides]